MKVYENKEELIKAVIKPENEVLDVGFWGQGVNIDDQNWPHLLIKQRAKTVYGIDLDFDSTKLEHPERYLKASAENFNLDRQFDVIFAGDLIEHLSNPGLFLDSARKHANSATRLIITTPNCFNLFNMAEKLTKTEPTVNPDHTCYFNNKTLKRLLEKNDWQVTSVDYLYSLGVSFEESWKKKILNYIYDFSANFTPKFMETLVVTAKRR